MATEREEMTRQAAYATTLYVTLPPNDVRKIQTMLGKIRGLKKFSARSLLQELMSAGVQTDLFSVLREFLVYGEGFHSQTYLINGHITIGVGLDLTVHPVDSKALFYELDPKRDWHFSRMMQETGFPVPALTEQQVNKLLYFTLVGVSNHVGSFRGLMQQFIARLALGGLADALFHPYQLIAMQSMAFNAPGLIGPGLMMALKTMLESSNDILPLMDIMHCSNANKDAGLQNRRLKEVAMFHGDATDIQLTRQQYFHLVKSNPRKILKLVGGVPYAGLAVNHDEQFFQGDNSMPALITTTANCGSAIQYGSQHADEIVLNDANILPDPPTGQRFFVRSSESMDIIFAGDADDTLILADPVFRSPHAYSYLAGNRGYDLYRMASFYLGHTFIFDQDKQGELVLVDNTLRGIAIPRDNDQFTLTVNGKDYFLTRFQLDAAEDAKHDLLLSWNDPNNDITLLDFAGGEFGIVLANARKELVSDLQVYDVCGLPDGSIFMIFFEENDYQNLKGVVISKDGEIIQDSFLLAHEDDGFNAWRGIVRVTYLSQSDRFAVLWSPRSSIGKANRLIGKIFVLKQEGMQSVANFEVKPPQGYEATVDGNTLNVQQDFILFSELSDGYLAVVYKANGLNRNLLPELVCAQKFTSAGIALAQSMILDSDRQLVLRAETTLLRDGLVLYIRRYSQGEHFLICDNHLRIVRDVSHSLNSNILMDIKLSAFQDGFLVAFSNSKGFKTETYSFSQHRWSEALLITNKIAFEINVLSLSDDISFVSHTVEGVFSRKGMFGFLINNKNQILSDSTQLIEGRYADNLLTVNTGAGDAIILTNLWQKKGSLYGCHLESSALRKKSLASSSLLTFDDEANSYSVSAASTTISANFISNFGRAILNLCRSVNNYGSFSDANNSELLVDHVIACEGGRSTVVDIENSRLRVIDFNQLTTININLTDVNSVVSCNEILMPNGLSMAVLQVEKTTLFFDRVSCRQLIFTRNQTDISSVSSSDLFATANSSVKNSIFYSGVPAFFTGCFQQMGFGAEDAQKIGERIHFDLVVSTGNYLAIAMLPIMRELQPYLCSSKTAHVCVNASIAFSITLVETVLLNGGSLINVAQHAAVAALCSLASATPVDYLANRAGRFVGGLLNKASDIASHFWSDQTSTLSALKRI